MDDPECDSTWEEDEDADAEDGEDGDEAGAGEADVGAEDEDEDEGSGEPRASGPGSLQVRRAGPVRRGPQARALRGPREAAVVRGRRFFRAPRASLASLCHLARRPRWLSPLDPAGFAPATRLLSTAARQGRAGGLGSVCSCPSARPPAPHARSGRTELWDRA